MRLGLGFEIHVRPQAKWIVVLFVMSFVLMFIAQPGMALAGAGYGDSVAELVIKLNDGNGNVSTLATYTVEQLKQMPRVERAYSSVDSMPAPVLAAARGVLLKDLLAEVNIDINTVEKFHFTATDDYRSILTRQYLFDTPRYYFPKIYECWDEDNTLESITYKPGVQEGKTPVEPVVAIEFHQARGFGATETTDRPRFDLMDDKGSFKLFFGQADAGELINNRFVKLMNGIEIVKLPSAVSAGPVSGIVMLTVPAAGQTYRPGDKVTISGTAQNLMAVTINVTAPGGQSVYSASNLDAKTGSFSAGFTLDAGAATGDYSININGAGLPGEYMATFQVVEASGSVTLTAPAADQTYRPEDKVTISGTAQNLAAVTIDVTAPGGQTVHTVSNLDAGTGVFNSGFTLDAGAATGDYVIKISGVGLPGECIATFQVVEASGIVTLTAPAEGDVFRPGDSVTISGTAQNLAAVTINVTAPGGQTIYTASNLDATGGSFSAAFTLDAGAADGEYNIEASGAGSAAGRTAAFKVSRLGGSVMLITITAGRVYQAGDEVTIGGTAQNLTAVTVSVTAPGGQTVHTANDLDAKSGSFSTGFTLGGNAAAGDYSIKISGAGMTHDYIMPFKVGKPVSPQGFLDLDKHWAQKEVNELAAKGVLKGVTETEFMPDARITRAQFAAMLVRALNIDPQPGVAHTFQDVPAGAWFHDIVGAAVKAGLVSGYSGNIFGPDGSITREQMAVMIARAMLMKQKLDKPDQDAAAAILQKFNDESDISDWAKAEVALAVKEGIVQGKQSDAFLPQEIATRAEAAVMISRYVREAADE